MTAPVAAELLAAGDWENALLTGLGQLVEDRTGWEYALIATGSLPLISLIAVPDAPDRVCVIDTYGGEDDPSIAHGAVYVQFRFRSRKDRPADCKGMAAAVANALHGAVDLTIGGIYCPTIFRDSHAQLGRDGSRRWERTDNYTITVDLPATGNRE